MNANTAYNRIRNIVWWSVYCVKFFVKHITIFFKSTYCNIIADSLITEEKKVFSINRKQKSEIIPEKLQLYENPVTKHLL